MAPAEERFAAAAAPATGEGTSPGAGGTTEPATSSPSAEGGSDAQKSDSVQQQHASSACSSAAAAPSSPPPPPPSSAASVSAGGTATSSSAPPPPPVSSHFSSPSSSSMSAATTASAAENRKMSPAFASPATVSGGPATVLTPPASGALPQQPPPPPPSSSFSSGEGPSSSSPQKRKQTNPPPRIVYDLPTENKSSIPPASSSPSNSWGGSTAADRGEGGGRGAVGSGCYLDAADSHLDLEISPDGLRATCLHTDGFQYTWKGVRSTYGVRGGSAQFYFEVKVIGSPSVVMPETPPATQNVCRIGVSQPFTSLFLGESGESWGYGGTAKKSHARKFENYGQPYGLHDVVGVVVDMQNLKLSFLKNGVFLGTAYTLPARVRDTGIFPHLYLKNVDVQVNFRSATAWFPPPNQQIQFIGDLPPQALLPNGVEHPRHVGECEFIMMVGLPACGKTFWAERHCMQNPTKSYVLLGTNAVIDQMRVMGVRRQANYASRWEELMTTATAIFNALVARAGTGKNPRNIIIDQTNVYRNARRRKVQPFLAWGIRRAVTIVNDEQTLQQRTQKREQEEGKFVPVSAVKEMQAAFCLPHLDDGFTVIEYPELPEMESRQQVRWYNEDGRRFKRENPNAMGNQTKPHMEKRRPEEFLGAAEMYPEKKRGRFGDDDPQQRQQQFGGGGGGPPTAGGGWGGGAAGGRRENECYGDGGRGAQGGRGQQQQPQWQEHQQQGDGGYGGGRSVQQQQDYYYSSPRGYQQQQQQPWEWQQQQQDAGRGGGGGPRPPRADGGGSASSYYEAEGHSNNRDYSYVRGDNGGQGSGRGYSAGRGRGGGSAGGGYQMRGGAVGGGNYYGDARGGRASDVCQQQQADGYFDGADAAYGGLAGGGGGRGRSYYAESSSFSASYYQGRTAAGVTGDRQVAAGRGDAEGYYAAGASRVDGRGNGAGGGGGYCGSWPDASAGVPAVGGGGMCGGNSRSGGGLGGGMQQQQQRQAWRQGRYRGGGGGNPSAGGGPGRRF